MYNIIATVTIFVLLIVIVVVLLMYPKPIECPKPIGCPKPIDCAKKTKLSIMTFNIRREGNKSEKDPKNNWSNRKSGVVKLINNYLPDVLCLQESKKSQVDYMKLQLLSHFGTHSGYRSQEPITLGLYNNIFYNPRKFKKIKKGTFWLSESPNDKYSKLKDLEPRICNWIYLQFKSHPSQYIYILNTHLSSGGKKNNTIRDYEINVIVNFIKTLDKDIPIILCGDFNATVDESYIKNIPLVHSFKHINKQILSTKHGTSNHGFNGEIDGKHVDHIFVSSTLSKNILSSHVIHDRLHNGNIPSDHYPVLTSIIM